MSPQGCHTSPYSLPTVFGIGLVAVAHEPPGMPRISLQLKWCLGDRFGGCGIRTLGDATHLPSVEVVFGG